jgi:predicted sulfurtransferase
MRLSLYVVLLCLLGAAVFSACNSNELKKTDVAAVKKPSPPPVNDGVRRITVQEAQDLFAKGQAVIVDVRNQTAYDQGHIKGARLIPVTEIQNHTGDLPKDKTIITYCS